MLSLYRHYADELLSLSLLLLLLLLLLQSVVSESLLASCDAPSSLSSKPAASNTCCTAFWMRPATSVSVWCSCMATCIATQPFSLASVELPPKPYLVRMGS